MIRQLRESHRRLVTLLALFLPVGYAAVLFHRNATTADEVRLAADLGGRVPVGASILLLVEPRIDARVLGTRGDWTPDALQIAPSGDSGIPDLLAYWSPTASDGLELPREAMLIGAVHGSREQVLPLPDPWRMQGGYVILYSLVRGKILAAVRMRAAT